MYSYSLKQPATQLLPNVFFAVELLPRTRSGHAANLAEDFVLEPGMIEFSDHDPRDASIAVGVATVELLRARTIGTCCKNVASAPPARRIANKNSALHKSQHISQRRILRALGQLGVFRCRQFSLQTIEQAV